MTVERCGMIHLRLPVEVMDELVDASKRRKTDVASEATLWLRVMAAGYKIRREAAGEELIRLPERDYVEPPPETAFRNRWDN